jgi:hypothetical protein
MASPSGKNAESLALAQRRFGRINALFWFFIVWIPLGVVLPCAASIVAYQIWGDTVSAPVGLSALLWPIVGIAGALLLRGGRKRSRRSLELARLADSLGLRFSLRADVEKLDLLKSISFMANPHAQTGKNLMEGSAGGRPMFALDYEYAYLWGSVTEIGAQTLVMFTSGFERLPPFGVIPISTMGKIENFLLGRRGTISFAQHPQFQRQFSVVGDDAPAITACISPALVEHLLGDRLLTLVVEGGRMLVFRRLTYVQPRDYQTFLAQAYRAAELLSGPTAHPPVCGYP